MFEVNEMTQYLMLVASSVDNYCKYLKKDMNEYSFILGYIYRVYQDKVIKLSPQGLALVVIYLKNILEDDYDSEFAFLKKPIDPLYSMDTSGRVIYMNTFSKSIARGIRAAYMVLPEALMPRFKETLGFYSCTVPVFDQHVLAEFLSSGSFERHLNRLRK